MYRRKVESLACIGIANIVDEITIRKIFKTIPLYVMKYSCYGNYEKLIEAKQQSYFSDGSLHVLLGHRGSSEENHIELLRTLKKYEREKIKIYMPLSYGDVAYIEKVKRFVTDSRITYVEIIDQFMEFGDYCKFLNSMDVAIFDGMSSYALGNIGLLLTLEKKIFLNANGVLREAFVHESVPYALISDIGKMTFQEFGTPVVISEQTGASIKAHDIKYGLEKWKCVFSVFN